LPRQTLHPSGRKRNDRQTLPIAGNHGSGRLIDRSRPLAFTFDGKRMTGLAGDTLASAVLANGQRLFGRSFKYHRPRGVMGLGTEEPNALVGIGEGARHEPNQRATQVELYDGMTAVSQNRWPSLEWDIGAVNSWISRIIPAGFYYKTLMWPQSFWKAVYEPLIRRAAGIGNRAHRPGPRQLRADARLLRRARRRWRGGRSCCRGGRRGGWRAGHHRR
jgi:NADPH-dependent 2,4-dienoyl-CoA reductase/sulfur reductase-like enzyme